MRNSAYKYHKNSIGFHGMLIRLLTATGSLIKFERTYLIIQ